MCRARRPAASTSRTSSSTDSRSSSGSVERNTGGEDDLVGAGLVERPREVVLKHPAARRRRSRLEDRPDAAIGIRPAHGPQRLENRRRMVREVVEHRDAARLAAQLEPAPHALERRQPARSSPRPIEARRRAPTAIAASAFRTLCAPKSGSRERARAARRARVRRRTRCGRRPARSSDARQSASGAEAERLDRRSARDGLSCIASALSAPRISRPLRGTSSTNRRNATRSDSMSG